jgi:phage-related protein
MFDVKFYEKADGSSPVRDWLDELEKQASTSKTARVRLKKTLSCMLALSQGGSRIGMPAVRRLDGDIWELRPLSDRVLFFFAKNNTYVLLHQFVKKTQEAPPREIEQAKREMRDYIERNKK